MGIHVTVNYIHFVNFFKFKRVMKVVTGVLVPLITVHLANGLLFKMLLNVLRNNQEML